MPLLFLEFIGTSELLVIMVVALIVFGPRKLPELGRSLGKSIGEFKRASEDFKRTWEREVELERTLRDVNINQAIMADLNPKTATAATPPDAPQHGTETLTVARTSTAPAAAQVAAHDQTAIETPEPARKQEWL